MQLVTDSSMDSDETSCDDDSSWVYESESSDGSRRLKCHYSFKKRRKENRIEKMKPIAKKWIRLWFLCVLHSRRI